MNVEERQNLKGAKRVIYATLNTWKGLKAVWKDEAAFREEVYLAVPMAIAAFLLPVSGIERALMLMCLFIVLITEILNTAIEAAIDRIGPEHHEISGLAKDLGSAAVAVALVMTGLVWAVILYENFGNILFG